MKSHEKSEKVSNSQENSVKFWKIRKSQRKSSKLIVSHINSRNVLKSKVCHRNLDVFGSYGKFRKIQENSRFFL